MCLEGIGFFVDDMLLKGLLGCLLRSLRQPGIVGLKAHDRGKVTAVGALGLYHLYLAFQPHFLDHAAEEFSDVLAAFFLALAAGAYINYVFGCLEIFAHVGLYDVIRTYSQKQGEGLSGSGNAAGDLSTV